MPKKYSLLLLVLACTFLSSCKLTSDTLTPSSETSAVTPQPTPQFTTQELSPTFLGFYDVTSTGQARTIRNDLTGSLSGQVQFVQSHSIDSKGNVAKNMPTLVAERTTLLLFMPSDASDATNGISVQVNDNGTMVQTLVLSPPGKIPHSDHPGVTELRANVEYSAKAWSVKLPWNLVKPGLSLVFTAKTKMGTLPASDIELSAPSELVIHSIRLGMLTSPPSGPYWMESNPAKAGSDYFQTIPVSRLVVANYAPVQLNRVIVGSGTIYDTVSATNGDTYSGDMREDVAKAQVATGINLANMGITDDLIRQYNPHVFNQRFILHAQGNYANGVQSHGLSGGNGMAMLFDSAGNEHSHEFGHSWGLGHYPGATTTSIKAASHHADSGWGYIAYLNRFRSNFLWGQAFVTGGTFNLNSMTFAENFAGLYNYNTDTMSGGYVVSPHSRYTHHIGFSAKAAQDHLAPKAIPDPTFPSGAKVWRNNAWVDARMDNPLYDTPNPLKVGVPVVTFLGGYHVSDDAKNLIYPAFFSNWGNVYNLPQPATTGLDCWVRVTFVSSTQDVRISPSDGAVRQLNFNIEASRNPQSAAIMCRNASNVVRTLSTMTVTSPSESPKTPVIIGQGNDYADLTQEELISIIPELAIADTDSPIVSTQASAILLRWRDSVSTLPTNVLNKAQKIILRFDGAVLLENYVTTNGMPTTPSAAYKADIANYLMNYGILETVNNQPKFPLGVQMIPNPSSGQSYCIALIDDGVGGLKLGYANGAACTANTALTRWWMDKDGKIRNAADADKCMVYNGNYSAYTIGSCAQTNSNNTNFSQQSTGVINIKIYSNQLMDCYCTPPWSGPVSSPTSSADGRIWPLLSGSKTDFWNMLKPTTVDYLQKLFPS